MSSCCMCRRRSSRLSSSVLDPAVYPPVEKAMGIEMARYALTRPETKELRAMARDAGLEELIRQELGDMTGASRKADVRWPCLSCSAAIFFAARAMTACWCVSARAMTAGRWRLPASTHAVGGRRQMHGWVRAIRKAYGDDALRRRLLDAALADVVASCRRSERQTSSSSARRADVGSEGASSGARRTSRPSPSTSRSDGRLDRHRTTQMPKPNPRHPNFPIPGGPELRAKGWRQEALLRLLENVLSVGEDPDNLIVYAALGKAARNWAAHEAIVKALTEMDEDQTLVIQSGKPIGLVKTHAKAPLVIMANCNIVGQWAKAEVFYELREEGADLLGRADGRRLAIYRQPGRHPGHLRDLHAHRREALRRRSSPGASS